MFRSCHFLDQITPCRAKRKIMHGPHDKQIAWKQIATKHYQHLLLLMYSATVSRIASVGTWGFDLWSRINVKLHVWNGHRIDWSYCANHDLFFQVIFCWYILPWTSIHATGGSDRYPMSLRSTYGAPGSLIDCPCSWREKSKTEKDPKLNDHNFLWFGDDIQFKQKRFSLVLIHPRFSLCDSNPHATGFHLSCQALSYATSSTAGASHPWPCRFTVVAVDLFICIYICYI